MLRRMSISAPMLSVSAKSPLWLRLTGMFVGLALAAAVGAWLYDLGSNFAGFNKEDVQKEINKLRADNATLVDDRDRLTKLLIAAESTVIIEKATSKQIQAQSKQLEVDNAKLKEDLTFFESLLPATGGADAVSIRNVRALHDTTAKTVVVRTLVMQGGKQTRDFEGTIQVVVQGVADGKPYVANFPTADRQASEGKISFNRYKRLEFTVPLPATTAKNVVLKTVQIKVLQGTQTRAIANGVVVQGARAVGLEGQ